MRYSRGGVALREEGTVRILVLGNGGVVAVLIGGGFFGGGDLMEK